MYKIYAELRDLKGVSDYQVAKATGINRSMFSDWKSGRSTPKRDRIEKIAEYFGVSPEYIITGESKGVQTDVQAPSYYIDAETRALAQELHDNPELSVMLDAYKTLSPRDAKLVMEMVRRMQNEGTN